MSFPEIKFPQNKYTIHSDEVTKDILWLIHPDGSNIRFTHKMKAVYFKILGLWASYLQRCSEGEETKLCRISIGGIATLLDLDRKTVREAIKAMKEVGVITFLGEGKRTTSNQALLSVAPLYPITDRANIVHSIWWYGLDHNQNPFQERVFQPE